MWRAAWLVATGIVGVACDAARGAQPDAASDAAAEDRDADGLCDGTEVAMGSDPGRADSDGDGLLDGAEVIAGFDLRDREDPGSDRIVFLRRGGSAEVLVSLGVGESGSGSGSGSGSDVSGGFSDRNAFDIHARRAGDFFTRSVAVAAVPPEQVRAVDEQAARFEAVRGSTQLQFRLYFEAADAGADRSNAADACAAVLPFVYAANTDDGTELTQTGFVLIVANDPPPLTAAQYCLPAACL